jgi:hypothetical protein
MNIEHLINDILIAKKKKKSPLRYIGSIPCFAQGNKPIALMLWFWANIAFAKGMPGPIPRLPIINFPVKRFLGVVSSTPQLASPLNLGD